MSKEIKLYPPGSSEAIVPHKSDIKYLKSMGWTEEKQKDSKPKPKVKSED